MSEIDNSIIAIACTLAGCKWDVLRESVTRLQGVAEAQLDAALASQDLEERKAAMVWWPRVDALIFLRTFIDTVEDDCWWKDTDG